MLCSAKRHVLSIRSCCTLSHGLRGWTRRRRSRRGSGWRRSRRWLPGRGLQRYRRGRIPWSIVEGSIVTPWTLRWWAVRGRGSIRFHTSEVYASSLIPWLWSHKGDLVIASSNQSPQCIKFTLDWSVPFSLGRRFSHMGLLRLGFPRLILLFWQLNNSIFGFFQFCSFLC